MDQFVEVKEAADSVFIEAKLRAHLIPAEEGGYVAHCPSLDIVSQGETIAEATANIKEAIEIVLDASFERGTLKDWLAEAGISGHKSRKKPRKPLAANVREIRVPARIPLAA